VPEAQSWVAVNPDSELLPVARANGIAYFEPTPQGSLVRGAVGADGHGRLDDPRKWFFKKAGRPCTLYWPGMEINAAASQGQRKKAGGSVEDQARERERKVKELADFFADARAYAQARRPPIQTNGAPGSRQESTVGGHAAVRAGTTAHHRPRR